VQIILCFCNSRSTASQEGFQIIGQAAAKDPKEEGGIRRWQGQEEEVVQRKGSRQVEQSGSVRQGYLRKIVQGSALLQADHPIGRVGKAEGSWLIGQEGVA
jgi:hypothetical protein